MSNRHARRQDVGLLLVVSSPSGAGKTTLARRLRDDFSGLGFSVSYTTRPPRTGEQDGVDYHFVTQETFDRMVGEGRFAEWAHVHGHSYGTAYEAIDQALKSGTDMLFDIDYQGGRQIKSRFPDAVMVFVLPPSVDELARRLRGRATDSKASIEKRLHGAVEELNHYDAYEYLVVNENLDRAYDELRAVYVASRCNWRLRAHFAEQLVTEARRQEP
ncbi:MAG: guanylate kinase [Deltaproteobacteria bacterium]|nr:guanylate kinase [Deltaproteobacteria bacterium]